MYYLPLLLFGLLFVTLTFGADILGQPDEGPDVNLDLDFQWRDYIYMFNKTYEDEKEAEYRRFIWEDNLATITKHNKEAAEGKQTYFMGVNAFTDWTFEEFSARYLDEPRPVVTSQDDLNYDDDDFNDDLDSHYRCDVKDWRKQGVVTPVKDQGRCESCWTFSTTGSIESQVAIKYKKLVPLSEQMLIDCCRRKNHGCKGGWVTEGFKCIRRLGGIDTSASYPYEAKDKTCRFKRNYIETTVRWYKVWSGEYYLHKVVQQLGPPSVCYYASKNFQHYKHGIFTDNTCNIGKINHAGLVVGYGHGYWLVKNSWGTRWGMQGYFKIQRGSNRYMGMCMINYRVMLPIIK